MTTLPIQNGHQNGRQIKIISNFSLTPIRLMTKVQKMFFLYQMESFCYPN